MSSRILLLVCTMIGCGNDTPAGHDASPTDDAATASDAASDAAICTCSPGSVVRSGTIGVDDLTELSGLAASRQHADLLWANNDSGDSARLFAMSATGTSVAELTITGATARDWEDLATAPCGQGHCLYIADIGDNDEERAFVTLYEVDEPAQASGDVTAAARAFEVTYPDGAHNSEALIVDPRDGASYILTKTTGVAQVFRMPREATRATAVQIGTLTIPTGIRLITAADVYVDACSVRLLVRTYSHLFELTGPASMPIADLLLQPLVQRPVAGEPQGEAVAFLADGSGYITASEGDAQPLSTVRCE